MNTCDPDVIATIVCIYMFAKLHWSVKYSTNKNLLKTCINYKKEQRTKRRLQNNLGKLQDMDESYLMGLNRPVVLWKYSIALPNIFVHKPILLQLLIHENWIGMWQTYLNVHNRHLITKYRNHTKIKMANRKQKMLVTVVPNHAVNLCLNCQSIRFVYTTNTIDIFWQDADRFVFNMYATH